MSDTPNFFPDRAEWEDDDFIEEETILEEPIDDSAGGSYNSYDSWFLFQSK